MQSRRAIFLALSVTLSGCRTLRVPVERQIELRRITIDAEMQKLAHSVFTRHLKPIRNRIPDVDLGFVLVRNSDAAVISYVPTIEAGNQFDNCRAGRRDLGSLVKPFLYASALQAGAIRADESFLDAPRTFRSRKTGMAVQVGNYAGRYTYRMLTVAESLAGSSNVVAGTVYERLPLETVRNTWRALDLGESFSPDLLFVGRWDAPLLNTCAAYACFVNGGVYRRATFLSDKQGPTRRVFAARALEQVCSGLRLCVRAGTGIAAADLVDSVRGKTGSSSDALAVLQSQAVTGALWIGRRSSNLDIGHTGGSLAMPALAALFREFRQRRPEWLPSWSNGLQV